MTMQVKPIKTSVFTEGEDLLSFVLKYLEKFPKKELQGSVLVVTSKVVSLAEGRTVGYKSSKQKSELIIQESDFSLKDNILFTIKDGMVMAFAGVDESNGNGKIILLPKDSYKSAELLRKRLMHKLGLKNFGVLITDSGFIPLRPGAVGMALGYAGFSGVRNYIGKKDIFGRVLKMSKTDVADSLAGAAVVCMGEGKEQMPLSIITSAPVIFSDKVKKGEMKINMKGDMYAPLFKNIKFNGKKRN